jgi:hypothetical protein
MPLHPSQIVLIWQSPEHHCKTMAHKPPDAEALFTVSYSRCLPGLHQCGFFFCHLRRPSLLCCVPVFCLSLEFQLIYLVFAGMLCFWFVAARYWPLPFGPVIPCWWLHISNKFVVPPMHSQTLFVCLRPFLACGPCFEVFFTAVWVIFDEFEPHFYFIFDGSSTGFLFVYYGSFW